MKLPDWFTTVTPFSKYFALSLFIILPMLTFFLGFTLTRPINVRNNISIATISPTPKLEKKITTLNNPPFISMEFKKRLLEQNEPFFYSFKLPTSITSVPVDELVGMRCTQSFTLFYPSGNSYFDYTKHKNVTVDKETETFITDLKSYITQATGDDPQVANYCEIRTGKELITYGHSGSEMTFLEIANGNAHKLLSFNKPYMNCGHIVQWTNSGELSFICRGGDTNEHADVYTVSVDHEHKPILQCVTGIVGTDEPPTCN